jgi:hypothetical protein
MASCGRLEIGLLLISRKLQRADLQSAGTNPPYIPTAGYSWQYKLPVLINGAVQQDTEFAGLVLYFVL